MKGFYGPLLCRGAAHPRIGFEPLEGPYAGQISSSYRVLDRQDFTPYKAACSGAA